MNKKYVIIAGMLLLSLILISGCTKQSTINNSSAVNSSVNSAAVSNTNTGSQIIIRNFVFSPTPIQIKTGTTVTWVNQDSTIHSIKSDSFTSSGQLSNGQTYQYTFNAAGTYNYSCGIHPTMTGKIVVQ